jgi:hypothetical protein
MRIRQFAEIKYGSDWIKQAVRAGVRSKTYRS